MRIRNGRSSVFATCGPPQNSLEYHDHVDADDVGVALTELVLGAESLGLLARELEPLDREPVRDPLVHPLLHARELSSASRSPWLKSNRSRCSVMFEPRWCT